MPDRRSFIQTVSLITAGLTAPRWATDTQAIGRSFRADIVLQGGVVYDGTGRPPAAADVAIAGDRIEAVGPDLPVSGARVIDVRGQAVAPGFIDIHSHTDLELLINPGADSKVRQGVTTEVNGQDGASIGPWRDTEFEEIRDTYRRRYDVDIDFRTLDEFFHRLERNPGAVNIASMIGAGQVRGFIVGADDRPATPAELQRMVAEVETALTAGACGLSTGLEYIPGAFADLAELVTLSGPLRARNLPYASHMRNEDDQLLAAIEEALTVGRLAEVPVQISHLKAQGQRNWWKAPVTLHLLESARASGIDVHYDRYPYVAYSTGLTSLFPVWSRDGGNGALLGRLDEPSLARRIRADVERKINQLGNWDAVQISSTREDSLAWARGRKLGELAAERAVDPYDLLLTLIRGDRADSGMIGYGMSETNTAAFLAHPLGMICSDGSALATEGPLSTGSPHPRSYGTFARVLGHYCRDERVMPLEIGVHKMTAMPARKLRLARRGVVTPGYFADLVVFDPERIRDQATFTEPHQYAAGVAHVLVNGTEVLSNGEPTGAHPGRVLRSA